MGREQVTPEDTLRLMAKEFAKAQRGVEEDHKKPWYRLGVGGMIVGTLVLAAWDPINITNESEGDSELVAVFDRQSVVIADNQRYAYTHYEVDQWGPVNNPEATKITMLNKQMEYVPSGVYELVATRDEDLGFYILMQENDGARGIPFNYKNILFSAQKPEPCDIESEDNQIFVDSYCTPLEDPLSRGVEYNHAWQGHWGFDDVNILAKARGEHDPKIQNNFCELSFIYGSTGIGGPIVALDQDAETGQDGIKFAFNNHSITPRTIYLGVRRAIVAAFRRDAALQTGLPITTKNGMPVFLMQEEVTLLKQVSEREGKPIKDMTPVEYRTAVAFGKMQLFEQLVPGEIDPGLSLGLELAEYANNDKEVDPPKNYSGEEITEYNKLTYSEEYYCLPWTSLEGIEQSEKVWWIKEKLGELDGLQPYAGLQLAKVTSTENTQTDIQENMSEWPVQVYNVDPVEAERLIQQFIKDAGLTEDVLTRTGS
jgi:hypothetical protein